MAGGIQRLLRETMCWVIAGKRGSGTLAGGLRAGTAASVRNAPSIRPP